MNRLRLADVRVPVARVLNECATSDNVRTYANEAHRRLVQRGKWFGTLQKYQICVSNTGCLAWPRAIETIEAYWLCSTPGIIRNGFYETLTNGPGLLNDSGYCNILVDRGTSCTFDEIDGVVSKVMVQADVTEAAGKRILIRGYDQNAAWIRTQTTDGTWIDGEYVTIGTLASYTTNLFTKITETIKDVTNGPVRLWQYDTTLGLATRALAYYEPDETLPIYRLSQVPGLACSHGCGSSGTGCQSNSVTVLAKLRHIDTVVDNDFFLLGNLAAIKLMVMAILKEERNLIGEAQAYEAKALQELQAELSNYEGDGAVPAVKTESSLTWGAGVLSPLTLGYRQIY